MIRLYTNSQVENLLGLPDIFVLSSSEISEILYPDLKLSYMATYIYDVHCSLCSYLKVKGGVNIVFNKHNVCNGTLCGD